MTKRERITVKIESNKKKINELQNANVLLEREKAMICDKYGRYEEVMKTFYRRVDRKKVSFEKLVGIC